MTVAATTPLHPNLPAPALQSSAHPNAFDEVLKAGDPDKLNRQVIDLVASGVKIAPRNNPSKQELAGHRAESAARRIRAEQSMIQNHLDSIAAKNRLIDLYKASNFSPRSYQGLIKSMEQNWSGIEAGRASIQVYTEALLAAQEEAAALAEACDRPA